MSINMRNMDTNILLISLFFFSVGCSITPVQVAKKRYENVGQEREIEVIYEDKNTAILVGKRKNKKCRETETLHISNINMEKDWRVIQTENRRDCEPEEVKESFIEKYNNWKSGRYSSDEY